MLKVVEISLATQPSRPRAWSQPQRNAIPLPLSNWALGGAFAPNNLLFGRRHLQVEARRNLKIAPTRDSAELLDGDDVAFSLPVASERVQLYCRRGVLARDVIRRHQARVRSQSLVAQDLAHQHHLLHRVITTMLPSLSRELAKLNFAEADDEMVSATRGAPAEPELRFH